MPDYKDVELAIFVANFTELTKIMAISVFQYPAGDNFVTPFVSLT